MNDIRRTILWVIFGFSMVMLWDKWQIHNGHKATFFPTTVPAAAPAASATASTPSGVPVDSSTKPEATPSPLKQETKVIKEDTEFIENKVDADQKNLQYDLQIEKERESFKAECLHDRKAQDFNYQRLLKLKHYWEAASAMRICANFLGDAERIALVADAEIKYYKEQVSKKNVPASDKLSAIEALIKDYPDQGKQYENLIDDLKTKAEIEKVKEDLAKIKADMKSKGVHVGMTQYEVLSSNWGRPRHVNRTSNAQGTTEQWVYDGSYLYFTDGILTTIQN